jgi:hypothetical protein
MWGTDKTRDGTCSKTGEWLESAGLKHPQATTFEELLAGLPQTAQHHIMKCQNCQNYCHEFLESRKLLASLAGEPGQANPYFVQRVLAAIRSREDELERSTRAWAAVPRLASRLAGIATLILLLTGTWLFEGPNKRQPEEKTVEPTSTLFEDNAAVPTSKDEVLVSVLERGQ